MVKSFWSCIALGLLSALTSAHAADTWEGGEPLRNPWRGFPLGSTVVIREGFKEDGEPDGEPTTTHYSVDKVGAGGGVEAHFRSTTGGEETRSGRLIHLRGGDPDDLGLRLVETSDSTLEVGGEKLDVLIKVWRSDPESDRLELLEKPLPEIVRRGGLKRTENLAVKLTTFEAKDPEVAIPYHEISNRGADIALGPRTLKYIYEEDSPTATTRLAETVTDLAGVRKVGPQEVVCVRVESTSEIKQAGADEPVRSSRVTWYSDAVPGRLVHEESNSGRRSRSTSAIAMSVPEKRILPEIGQVGPAEGDPTISLPAWRGAQIGAWRIDLFLRQRGRGGSPIVKMRLKQIVEASGEDQIMTATKSMGASDWEAGVEYELLRAERPPREPDQRSETSIELSGESIPCHEEVRAIGPAITDRRWIPQDDTLRRRLAETGRDSIRQRLSSTHLPDAPPNVTEIELAEWSSGAPIQGRVVDCIRFTETGYSGEQKPASGLVLGHQFVSREVPGRLAANFSSGPGEGDLMISGCLAFGSAGDDFPSPEILQQKWLPSLIEFGKGVIRSGRGLATGQE